MLIYRSKKIEKYDTLQLKCPTQPHKWRTELTAVYFGLCASNNNKKKSKMHYNKCVCSRNVFIAFSNVLQL